VQQRYVLAGGIGRTIHARVAGRQKGNKKGEQESRVQCGVGRGAVKIQVSGTLTQFDVRELRRKSQEKKEETEIKERKI